MPHLLRGLALVSVVVAAVTGTGTDTALMALVAGGAAVPLLLRVPAALDAAYVVALLVAGWSSVLDLYETLEGWDLVVHLVATGVLALVAHHLVVRLGALPPAADLRTTAQRAGTVLVVAGLGSLLSVLWELGEWWGNAYLDPTIGVGYVDTVGDLVAGALGSALAAVVTLAGARRRARRSAAGPSAPTAAARPS